MNKFIFTVAGIVTGIFFSINVTTTAFAENFIPATESNIVTYTEEDLYVLAHVICGEAQCYNDKEQLYVGSVVLNRVAHPAYPNTIKKVVFQKGQYACIWDGNYSRTPTEKNWANAQYLLEHGSILPYGVVYQSKAKQGPLYERTKYHAYCFYK